MSGSSSSIRRGQGLTGVRTSAGCTRSSLGRAVLQPLPTPQEAPPQPPTTLDFSPSFQLLDSEKFACKVEVEGSTPTTLYYRLFFNSVNEPPD
jgi:hypothetical protein